MYLNSIKPSEGSKKNKVRVGRGIGSGFGKTCGRGHKGQKSRSGGFHKVGFEGGQMPIQRRLPKRGFVILRKREYPNIRLNDLNSLSELEITIETLIANNIVPKKTNKVKIFQSGNCTKTFNFKNIVISKGAKDILLTSGSTIS
ncbi:50S ribosomal protein L15 [Nitrosomonas sp. Is35]|uniref:50S ribosomal protein L15 n=1 Tax=unclassified Nitrosomonas TaxID=2609265 RepID=UPI00294B00E1|nr:MULTISPECIES: 50S ribosomal protein L15 [unclassified Nitrosomonas]MDV6342077.1 50S ribosomal protein L15 [Nitrosomonas sp. Is24]MDV6347985.1 50S ribosomal protein L15 [Nitrosomonas sp. Is35]